MLSEPCHPPIHTRVKLYQNLIASFFSIYRVPIIDQKVAKEKKKEEKQEKQ